MGQVAALPLRNVNSLKEVFSATRGVQAFKLKVVGKSMHFRLPIVDCRF